MSRPIWLAVTCAALLMLTVAGAASAHEGEGEEEIVVEPQAITAGDTVILAGSGLEPDDERVLVLAGAHLVVDLGTVETDGEGMFQVELIIPNHLPSGTYEVRAIGDETVTTTLSVTAAVGIGSPVDDAAATVLPRDRSALELGLLIGLVVVATAAGVLLVWAAERLGGSPTDDRQWPREPHPSS